MPEISFTKMHGLGNDYIYFNCLESPIERPEDLSPILSHRHFGIGGDGIVLIMESKSEDFRMRMFNADGSEAEMCGNAVRCVAKYLFDRNYTDKEVIRLETNGGARVLELNIDAGKTRSVRVDMGEPILTPGEIPINVDAPKVVNANYKVAGESFEMTGVSMGNPHAVLFVDEITDHQVLELGPKIEVDPIFPNRINAHFAQVIGNNEIRMRVWERGSGETQACGTGACAVLVAAVLTERTGRKALIHLSGGDLEIEWGENGHVYMTGPAEFVFDGRAELEW